MTVQSEPIKDGQRLPPARRPRVGFIPPGGVETLFRIMLYLLALGLALLSVLGTFYGRMGEPAPIDVPVFRFARQVVADVTARSEAFAIAFAIQAVLTAVQYGARQFADHDRRWWLLYLAALGFSVYYNVLAYWAPLAASMAWYLVAAAIVAGDVLPEFIAVRRR